MLPAHFNLAACWCVAHGVGQQIRKRAMQLCTGTRNITGVRQRVGIREGQHMRLCLFAGQRHRQATRLVLAAFEQMRDRYPVTRAGQRAALQSGQGQQVFHQMLHALSLLRHEFQIAVALMLLQRQVLQRFDKAGQYRERRANFMRHIGHKVAAHGFGLLHRGHITRQQQLAAFTISIELHRQLHRA